MRDLAVLLLHLVATFVRLAGAGGVRAVVAESLLLKQQLLILNRSRTRASRLRVRDRVVAGVCALLMRPGRLVRAAIVLKPSTLLRFHRALINRKYRQLFSSIHPKKRGPKGPSREVVCRRRRHETMKSDLGMSAHRATDHPGLRHSDEQGCGTAHLGGEVQAETGCGRTVLAHVLGHAKDSLWSVDLFRCESAVLRAFWVLVIMDQWTRRIVGFSVHRGAVDGVAVCRMFHRAMRGQAPPTYFSSDHDRLYQCQRWQANLRILDVEEIKTVPYAPLSHPFVERLIGTIRREYLDRTLFWTAVDLEMKLLDVQRYYNGYRAHGGLAGQPPEPPEDQGRPCANMQSYHWRTHCRGLYQTPIAA